MSNIHHVGERTITPEPLPFKQRIRYWLRERRWPEVRAPFVVNDYELRCPFCDERVASVAMVNDQFRPEMGAMHTCRKAAIPGVYAIDRYRATRVGYTGSAWGA